VNEVFGPRYADAYDSLYHDKDYAAECDLIENIFQRYGDGAIRRVLDLGCGTGNHSIPLAQRGYEVTGVDRSAEMLSQARAKAADLDSAGSLVFHQGDITSTNLQQQFDASLMMFAVMGYQLENAQVLSALESARKHLRPDGLLLFDVWYGPAVLRERPSQKVKVIPTSKGHILRVASGELNIGQQTCAVDFRIWQLEGDRLVARTEESHVMRYFFPLELELLLHSSGFALARLGAFPDIDQDPDETTWNIMGVARAK
jgi:SAM-dependent methyltransferase